MREAFAVIGRKGSSGGNGWSRIVRKLVINTSIPSRLCDEVGKAILCGIILAASFECTLWH